MKDWTFSDVPDGFDAHVRKQLPWYEFATNCVAFVARHYLPEGGRLYDIGASTGNITKALATTISERGVHAISVEPNEAMARDWQGYGVLVNRPVQELDIQPYDVAVLFLTMMFIPVAERAALMNQLRRNLRKGGVIIVVDKVAEQGGYFGTVMRRLTNYLKTLTGVSADEIVSKELQLVGVQRPTEREGTLFLKFGEFEGWVIEG